MRLELGKSYRDRRGRLVKITKHDPDFEDAYPFGTDEDEWYAGTGRYWTSETRDERDLITEWPGAAETAGDIVHLRARVMSGGKGDRFQPIDAAGEEVASFGEAVIFTEPRPWAVGDEAAYRGMGVTILALDQGDAWVKASNGTRATIPQCDLHRRGAA